MTTLGRVGGQTSGNRSAFLLFGSKQAPTGRKDVEMNLFLTLLLAAALLQAPPQAQPDFSGVWRLDSSRSETLQANGEIDRGPMVVSHSGRSLRITPSGGQAVVSYAIVQPAGLSGAIAPDGSAHWEGPMLVTEREGTVNGKSVIVKQSWTLAPGGSEMVVDTTVAVQHGYAQGEQLPHSTSRDVYIRIF